MTSAKTGIEARGSTATDRAQVPYKQDYAFNAFGNVTSRQTYHWTQTDNQTHSWVNNKESTWSYDADGRLKQTPKNRYYYDAKGATVMMTLDNNRRMIQHLDGESKPVRQDQYSYYNYQYNLQQSVYFIYSSVLGKLLTEVTSGGTKKRTFVYGINGVVALQQYGGTNQEVRWEHTDPSNATYIQTGYNGTMYYLQSPAELDPLGSSVGMTNPYNQPQPEQAQSPGWGYGSWGDPFGGYSCRLDGFEMPCSTVMYTVSIGAGYIRGVEVPPGLTGRWDDIDDPNPTPAPPGVIQGGGTISVFVPLLFNIGFGISQQDIAPLGDIIKDTKKFIDENKDCADFINSLLKKAAEITGVPSVPNPFSGNVIDFSTQRFTRKDGSIEILRAQAKGRFYTLPDGSGRRESFGLIGITPLTKETVYPTYEYIISYIHESIHNAAVSASGESSVTAYNDRILAIAAYNSIKGIPDNKLPKGIREQYERLVTDKRHQNTDSYSRFWNQLLQHFCPRK